MPCLPCYGSNDICRSPGSRMATGQFYCCSSRHRSTTGSRSPLSNRRVANDKSSIATGWNSLSSQFPGTSGDGWTSLNNQQFSRTKRPKTWPEWPRMALSSWHVFFILDIYGSDCRNQIIPRLFYLNLAGIKESAWFRSNPILFIFPCQRNKFS